MTDLDEMELTNQEGQVITFYSFKGGVGRSMALANVAFLAALNGQRVLVMDWDLEAPGLAYYFRGLLEGIDAKNLRDTPGVLNILWEWCSSVKEVRTNEQVEQWMQGYVNGASFQSNVRSLVPNEIVTLNGGALDFIGAGSRSISTPELLPYEEALAKFSWPKFFTDEFGGMLLKHLRSWAKSNYDLILLDSRTGLADVAGICTMQLPDTVVLAFILNRQNIDGVTKVAAAIRSKRNDDVMLRALPMRVSRHDTPEESDARARATSEFIRVGGFSSDSINEDFKVLSVGAADNVPFYETLAPFAAIDPSLDVLTLNYLRLATQLTGKTLLIPELDVEFIESVRRRLQPKHATAEYILKLKLVEPIRAMAELERLLSSAIDTEIDGNGLDDEYINTLVDTAFGAATQAEDYVQALNLYALTLDLLRFLSISYPNKWDQTLASALERHIDEVGFLFEHEDLLSLLEELDSLLSNISTIAARLKRIRFRRRAGRIFFSKGNPDDAAQTIGETLSQIKEIRNERINLSIDQNDDLLAADADVAILRGDINRSKGMGKEAYEDYRYGLYLLTHVDSSKGELIQLKFDLHCRLADLCLEMNSNLEATQHSLQATRSIGTNINALIINFIQLANAVLVSPDQTESVLEFCENVFFKADRQSKTILTNYFGRQLRLATNFLYTLERLSQSIADTKNLRSDPVRRQIGEVTEQAVRNLFRRKQTIGDRQIDEISRLTLQILKNISTEGNHPAALLDLIETFGIQKRLQKTDRTSGKE